jgi:hypothetical protein
LLARTGEAALPSKKSDTSQSTTFFQKPKTAQKLQCSVFSLKKTSPNNIKKKMAGTPLPTLTRVYSKTHMKNQLFVGSLKKLIFSLFGLAAHR